MLTLCELEYGLANAPANKKGFLEAAIRALQQDFDAILPLDSPVAPIYGRMKAWLRDQAGLDRKGMRRHNIDLLLASCALTSASILVGADRIFDTLKAFDSELRVENWLTEQP